MTSQAARGPPDGGWGWVVLLASLCVLTLRTGITWVAFPILYADLVTYFGTTTAATGWVASTFVFTNFAICLVTSPFQESHGSRIVGIVGTLAGSVGLILSSMAPSISVLCITYGLITGCGVGCTAFAALLPTQEYFTKKRPLAAGIATMGVGLGQIFFPPFVRFLLDEYGWRGTMLLNAALNLHCVIFCALFRPLTGFREPPGSKYLVTEGESDVTGRASPKMISRLMPARHFAVVSGSNQDITILRSSNDVEIDSTDFINKPTHKTRTENGKLSGFSIIAWIIAHVKGNARLLSDARISLYLLGNFGCNFGLWTLYTHSVNRALSIGVGQQQAAMLTSVIGISNLIGRLVISVVSTFTVSRTRLVLFSTCFLMGGAFTMAVAVTRNFLEAAILSGLCGVTAGGALGLQITVLIDIAGVAKGARAASMLLTISGIAALLALPLGGWLYDVSGDYCVTFTVNGALQVLGCFFVLSILCFRPTAPRGDVIDEISVKT